MTGDFATKLYLIFTWITLTRLLKTFPIKNKVTTFKNVNWEFCSIFNSLIKIVEHKKHKFPFILLPFVFRSSHQRCSVKKGVVSNFTKFTEKHLRPATLLKKRLWHRCFPVNFAFLWTTASVLFNNQTSAKSV